MTLQERIATIRRTIAEARSMPMSASAVVNRAELLALLDELADAVRVELAEAVDVGGAEDDVVGEGRRRTRSEGETLRKEVDDYVDTKLAGFEVALERSLDTVRRGRARLAAGDGTAGTGLEAGPLDGPDEIDLPSHLGG